MHGHREGRERGDGPVVEESVAQSVRQGARGGRGRLHHSHTTITGTNTATTTPSTAGRVNTRTDDRASEATTISVVASRYTARRSRPSSARAGSSTRAACGRDDERERAAQDQRAHASRLTSLALAARPRVPALGPILASDKGLNPTRRRHGVAERFRKGGRATVGRRTR